MPPPPKLGASRFGKELGGTFGLVPPDIDFT